MTRVPLATRDQIASTAGPVYRSGRWTPASHCSRSTLVIAKDTLYFSPLFVNVPITISRMSIEVVIAGAGGAVTRLGVYDDDDGLPGQLLLDAGTVSTTTTGMREVTGLDLDLPPARYWVAAVGQVATPADHRIVWLPGFTLATPNWIGVQPQNQILQTGVTGALPPTAAPLPVVNPNGVPLIAVMPA